MHDQWVQVEFENSDVRRRPQLQSQRRTDLDLTGKEIRERHKDSKVIPKMKQSLEVQDLFGA